MCVFLLGGTDRSCVYLGATLTLTRTESHAAHAHAHKTFTYLSSSMRCRKLLLQLPGQYRRKWK